jgi:glycosyltransferase involved in cell wall biosynthesis
MKLSIIIPTYKREHLLDWNLKSISKQKINCEYEIIVLNDGILDETENVCKKHRELNIKYFFTGQRNLNGNMVWRVPGFAINIGVKKSQGEIILLSCAEMFGVNDSINEIMKIYESDCNKKMGIPFAKDDNGVFLKKITDSNGVFDIADFNSQPPLINVKFPFFLSMQKKEFVDIGGYDEDFTGTDFDDTDLVGRLVKNGNNYVQSGAKVIHLWHERLPSTPERMEKLKYNQRLYQSRINIIKRNENKKWGLISENI